MENKKMKMLIITTLLGMLACNSIEPNSQINDIIKTPASHFLCKSQGSRSFRPYYMKLNNDGLTYKDYSLIRKGLLGQNSMTSPEECQKALDAANNKYGVICSRTGLDGWKPTLYTGTSPGRQDFGYLGGSSIMNFEHCILATLNSSKLGVCYWGGSAWYRSPINKKGTTAGPFSTVERCILNTRNSDAK
jgi:hypothetical protein